MIDGNGYGNTKNLAKLLGLTPQRVSQLVKENVIKRKAEGDFHFQTAIADYFAWKCEGNGNSQEDYWQEKAIHERVKRETAELNLEKLKNNIYDAKHVELVMIEIISTLRSQLLGLPNKLAPILEGKTRDEIYSLTTKEIEEKLSELSEYSPELFTDEEIEENEIPE